MRGGRQAVTLVLDAGDDGQGCPDATAREPRWEMGDAEGEEEEDRVRNNNVANHQLATTRRG